MNPSIECYINCYKQPRLIPTHEGASGMTPSLAALDDATSLRQREWIRTELGEDTPQQ